MPFRWLFDDGQQSEACLDILSHAEWLEFVFDHPTPQKSEERWYSLEAAEPYYYKDSLLFLSRLTRLMQEPDILLNRYSPEQIRQGFWCFISAFELPDILEDKSLDFEPRRDCIAAIESLYRRLFKRPGFEKIAFLYWDPLTYSFADREGLPRDGDHAVVQDALFRTLEKILIQPERSCFLGALHGLGHLRHERGAQAIRDALARRSPLGEDEVAYALACVRGNMDAEPSPF